MDDPMKKVLISSILFIWVISISLTNESIAETTPPSFPQSVAPNSPIPVKASELPPPNPELSPIVEQFKSEQLSPEDIIAIRKIILEGKRAKLMPLNEHYQAKPVNRRIIIDLSPNAPPNILRLGYNQGASITFSDANGKEWPMLNFTNFTPSVMKVLRPVETASLLTIEPAETSGMGNFAAFLKNPNGDVQPVAFTVLLEQSEADYVVQAVMPMILSSSSQPSVYPAAKSEALELALLGIQPAKESIELISSDPRVQAWKVKNTGADMKQRPYNMLLRSKSPVLSPAPLSGKKLESRDGTRAYELPYSPIITILSEGKSFMVKLNEPELKR